MMQPKIIVTMTSWKGRISTTGQMIDDFCKNQTRRFDKFYLWLSLEEFPNREKDLPQSLIDSINRNGIVLKWLEGNEYCHKRWHVYPEHFNDYVISIDDDCFYSPTVIEDSFNIVNQFKNTVCGLWWQFSAIPTYNDDAKIQWKYDFKHFSIRNWFTANSMIPPKTFPLEALEKDVIEYRNKYAKKHDEAWIIPYLLKHDVNVAFIPKNYPFKTVSESQKVSLSDNDNGKKTNGYSQTEYAIYYMLKKAEMLEKYKNVHFGYSYDKIKNNRCE